MTGKSFEELRVGDIGFIEKTISETDVYMYAGITGDFNVNGHLKTGTFGHEKSSTKSWKLIPPLHQSDLVEPNGCEFGSCNRAG